MGEELQRGRDPRAGRGRTMAVTPGRMEHWGGELGRTQPGECRDEGCQGRARGSERVGMGWSRARCMEGFQSSF